MAHIFKHPSNGQKGIVVFTHKEIRAFQSSNKYIDRIKSKLKIPQKLHSFYRKNIEEISKKYFIGLHFGWYHENYPVLDFVDFYMGGEGTVSFQGEVFFIPLNSSSFTPSEFNTNNMPSKYWDIICVSNIAKHKHLDLFMKEIKKIYELGYKYKVLLLNTSKANESTPRMYSTIVQDYYDWFSFEERQNFTLLKLNHELGFLGISQTQLSHFYKSSKVFTLFSKREGESRVISEALMCGLPVVVKADLEGGGRDFLNEDNSYLFDVFDNAHRSLIHTVENLSDFNIDTESVRKDANEIYSLGILKQYFEKLYKEHNSQFDNKLINTDYLNFRLPGHYLDVRWSINRHMSADIVTRQQMNYFLMALKL